LAAARSIAGPPMSMFSIASSRLQSGPCDRLLERVQIDDQQVDRRDAVLGHHRFVNAAAAEQTAVHLRMQRLDAAIHDLGEAGQLAHLAHRQARLAQRARAAAGGDQLHAQRIQRARQIGQPVLVGYAQQGAPHRRQGGVEHDALQVGQRGRCRIGSPRRIACCVMPSAGSSRRL